MALITDSDLASFLGNPAIQGSAQGIIAATLASGVVTDILQNEGVGPVTTFTDLVIDGPQYGTNVFLLPGNPVTDVASVALIDPHDATGMTWQPPLVPYQDYTWNNYGVVSRTQINDASQGFNFWPPQMGSIKITYTTGMVTIPASVQALALGMAARAYTNPAGLTSESISGYSSQFSKNPQMFLAVDPMELASIFRWVEWGFA